MKTQLLSAACLAAMACGTLAHGQQANDQDTRVREGQNIQTQRRDGARTGEQQRRDTARTGEQRRSNLDQQLATMLVPGNQAEIELGKLALQKSQNEGVKQFAQTMIDHHGQYLNDLKQFSPRGETNQPGQPGNEAAANRDNAAAAPDNRAARTAPGDAEANTRSRPGQRGGQGELNQVRDTAAKYKLSLTKQMLEEYQGQDFDMGYLGQQIVAHIEMLAKLKAMENHGSPEFQQTVKKGIQTTEGHLKQARALAMQLEDKEGGDTSAQPQDRPATR